ncbi:ribosome biogenesis GTPase A [Fervidobacterium changbaicum]|uniref:Ribosome biogenesis GTPase A n=2 Tax=Fervidobacterium TaxID=2422 RepID=A0AAI8GCW7_FERIS|nr:MULTISPECIES: GTPase [Fervidobacterium]AMW32738.1 50S ribosome-binding GTPase [Fervidobacterium islandicum]QAV32774.1 GTPase RsgA [Fervidobacterium changbaicum]SDG95977.1 ribosome biogenesis GTPase A [Fervidobacterium changbaicum]
MVHQPNEHVKAWYPGHVQKAKRQIKENLKKIDIVIIVLDARAPVATTSFELKIFKDKQCVFLLNKSDLADPKYNKEWVSEISKSYPTLLVNKETNRRELLNFLKSIPTKYANPRIAVVGVPNVGKSTIINKILGKHKAKTGAQPGITRGVQWVNVEGFTVLDSPGILFSEIFSKDIAAKLLLIGSLPLENIDDEIFDHAFSVYALASGVQKDLYQFLEEFGRSRGLLKKGGQIDYERAKILFFKEVSEGKHGKLTYDTQFERFWEVLRDG